MPVTKGRRWAFVLIGVGQWSFSIFVPSVRKG